MKKTKMRLLGWLIEVKKTSFGCYLILTFLAVLIELYYRLSRARSLNLSSASTLLIINQ